MKSRQAVEAEVLLVRSRRRRLARGSILVRLAKRRFFVAMFHPLLTWAEQWGEERMARWILEEPGPLAEALDLEVKG